MSEYRALQLYASLLRGFQNRLSLSRIDADAVIENAFGFLQERLGLESIALFWWSPEDTCFKMQYEYRAGILMEGEEEIEVTDHSPFYRLLNDKLPFVSSVQKPWVAYLPLHAADKVFGAVRVVRARRLPRGRVLRSLPRYHPLSLERRHDSPLLEDVADILSARLQLLRREGRQERRERYLRAGAEVTAAVVETPRLREMLESVGRSIVDHLGFDRIRFYLIDPSHTELKGAVGFQIPDRVLRLDDESYPLKLHANSLVDALLENNRPMVRVAADGKVVYAPLTVNGQSVGCMAVDNLLSQVVIDEEQMVTLRSLAGQISMAVLNARLFEDIEQQAITDGLTKLYVYRYFQQRLKEEIDRADRYSYGVALIMMDVDQFKSFNDTYGHAVGDRVLELLSQTIRANIRRIDLAARYGGDEFILLLPEITEQEAWMMGTRLQNALRESAIPLDNGDSLTVRVTMGVAMYVADAKSPRELMETADRALYWAKKNAPGELCFYGKIAQK